jgi:hypothetical protein
MSLGKFISSLFASSKKDNVIKATETIIDTAELAGLEILQLKDADFSQFDVYKNVDFHFKNDRDVKAAYKGNLIQFLRGALEELVEDKSKIISILEESFRDDIQVEGLDYRRASLLQYVAAIDWFVDYVTKFGYVLSASAIKDPYTKMARLKEYEEFVVASKHKKAAGMIAGILRAGAKKLKTEMTKLKDISFVAENHDLMMKTQANRVDPLKMNLLPGIGHIALFLGDIWNDWVSFRAQRAKALKESAELNILYLERDKAGAPPEELERIEKQIKHYRARINKLDQQIKEMQDGV